jgi:hypothetical protein
MAAPRRRPLAANRARGAALIILMALLAMGVLYFVTMQLEAVSLYQKEALQGGGRDSLTQAREALLGHATTYRDDPAHITEVFGYLPCPDTTGDGESDPPCGNAGEASVGLFPFKTLGLPDLHDGAGGCLWYAVAGSFKNLPKAAATVMNWDTQGQFRVRDAGGNTLVAPDDAEGGAAAVVFAAGPPVAGQNRGVFAAEPCRTDPSLLSAYLDGGYTPATFATNAAIALIQGPVTDGNGNVTNNDRLVWITPREIFDRIAKRQDFSNPLTASPPGQINTLADRIKATLDLRIQNDIFDGTITSLPTNKDSYTPKPAGIYVGEVDPAMDIGLSAQTSYANYLANWAEQFRQGVCDNLSAPCLDINNGGTANCRGVLMLGGRMAGGQPRPSAQKGSSLSILANYFDGGSSTGAKDLLALGLGRFIGRASYAAPAIPVTGAFWSGGTATLTTASAHGLTSDFYVTVSGVGSSGPASYNGTYKITVSDATHFTFSLALDPGTYLGGGSADSSDVAACLGYGSFVSLKNDAVQFASGTIVPGGRGSAVAEVTSGTSPEIILGSTTAGSRSGCVWYPNALPLESSLRVYFKYRIDSATTGSNARGYALALADATTNSPYSTDPLMCGSNSSVRLGYAGAAVSGTATVLSTSQAISSTSWSYSTGLATISTALPHGFYPGDSVTVAGASPSGYNGTYTIDSISGFPADRFSYFVGYPGPPRAGIAPPKIGVEFDTNPETLTSINQRNDPSAEHFAYLYWGSAGDNNMQPASTTRDGSDDNYHGAGVAGDGSQPLNPRTLSTTSAAATAVANIAAARWTGGTATVMTSAPHGFPNGQRVVVSDTGPLGYKGTYTATVTAPNQFTYPLATDPGTYPYIATVAAASWASGSGGLATITTSAAHGLSTGQSVSISNASPSGWNGTYVVTVTGATQFTYALTSNPGTHVSGGQVSQPLSWVNSTSWSSDIVTIVTAAAHNLRSEQYVTISGILPAGYNGTYRVTVIDATRFSYRRSNPGAYVSGGLVALAGITGTVMAGTTTNITGTTWATSGTVTVTTAAAHGLSIGKTVYINGVTPAGYNGVYAITSVPSSTSFNIGLPNAGLAAGAGGLVAVAAPANATISSAVWSSSNGGAATLATSAAHGFTTGQVVNISGVSPGGYNGAFAITVINATNFSYALSTDPGGSFAATTFATPGIATVKSSDLLLPYNGTMPKDTDIHVRLDVNRSYDAARHQATLTLRAYIGDNFSTGNCGLADFKNFTRDLSVLCPIRTPTIEQSGIVINDIAGPALRNIYFGYSTARGSSLNDNETIHIQNLILRSQ